MKVALEIRGPVDQPYLKLNEEQIVGMTLRPGSMEIGSRPSALQRITFDAGLMGLCPPQSEYWIGRCNMTHITMTISDEALMAAANNGGEKNRIAPRTRTRGSAIACAGHGSGRGKNRGLP